MPTPFFGIRISTYRRRSGTLHLLHRCLRSVVSQTFQDWKVFLVGDHYEPDYEFKAACKYVPQDKITSINLPSSPEREKYSGNDLWRVAGYTATCMGLKMVQSAGIPVVCCMDDDDWWTPDHLQTLHDGYVNFPDAAFIYTRSTYKSAGKELPTETPPLAYDNLPPKAYNLIHSSASWDVRRIPIVYRHVIETKSSFVAGDADMWETIRKYCHDHGHRTLFIPKLTVRHDSEHGTNNDVVRPLLH